MQKVAIPINSSVVTSIALRPILSPKWPKNTPPNGLAAKPTPNVAKASSVPMSGSDSGKNSGAKTTAAAVPYRK